MALKYKKINRKTVTILIICSVVVISLGFIGKKYLLDDKPLVDTVSKTTSDVPSAQSNFKSDEDREPATSPQKAEITVNDTGGSIQAQSNSATLVSKDGAITVKSPTANSVFTSGSSLFGNATVPKVSYRLIDNVSGVTATGELSVINGNFSGKFSFSTKASEGRLDVFQTGNGGIEQSIIEIPVRFR